MVEYSLTENILTAAKGDYRAQITDTITYDKEALISRILQRGTLLTRTDILAVINAMEETVVDIHKEGGTVTLPLFSTGFSISGVFKGTDDSFDGTRHRLNITVQKGKLLKLAQQEIRPQKVDFNPAQARIYRVTDVVSGQDNEKLTPGGVVKIFGTRLKISGKDTKVGLWFVAANGTETKADHLVRNMPSELTAIIPTLTPGKYHIKLVTQYSGGTKELKTTKSLTYDKELTVF